MNKIFLSAQSHVYSFSIANFDLVDLKFKKKLTSFKNSKRKTNQFRVIFSSTGLLNQNVFYLARLLYLEWESSQRNRWNLNYFPGSGLPNNTTQNIEVFLCKKNYFKFLDSNLNTVFLDKNIRLNTAAIKNYSIQFPNGIKNYSKCNFILFNFVSAFETKKDSQIQILLNKSFASNLVNLFSSNFS